MTIDEKRAWLDDGLKRREIMAEALKSVLYREDTETSIERLGVLLQYYTVSFKDPARVAAKLVASPDGPFTAFTVVMALATIQLFDGVLDRLRKDIEDELNGSTTEPRI